MERLTGRMGKYADVIEMGNLMCREVCAKHSCDDCSIQRAFEKLCAYEDAEEQGLLLRLPCRVGDTVWCLEEDSYVGYVFIAMGGEYYIVSASYSHCDDIYEQLEEMEDDTENGFEPSVSVFHKNKVFLTRAEAEKALEEMG